MFTSMDATSMDATRCSESSRDREERLRGNAKGPAAQPRRPNKGHIGYGSGENETELDALYRALRGERESCSVCALPVMTDHRYNTLIYVAMDVVTRGGAGRPIDMCTDTTVLLRAWILQDLRRTEMRGYGVYRRERERTHRAGETAEQRERRLRQRRERDRLDAVHKVRRGGRVQMRATSSERLASETAEEREDRLQRLTDRLASETP